MLGQVWYRVLTTRLLPNATFTSFAKDTLAVADQIFGEASEVHEALLTGWSCAGIDLRPHDQVGTFVATLEPSPRRRLHDDPPGPRTLRLSP